MFDMRIIGERLTEERNRLNLAQTDVTKMADITQATLSRYERGERVPTLEACFHLYNIGYDILYVMTGDRGETNDRFVTSRRLVDLPDVYDVNVVADRLMVMMYHAEESMLQFGAVAEKDYTLKDLALIASNMMEKTAINQ